MTTPTRTEHDSLGDVQVPIDSLWGAQTQRACEHFNTTDEKFPLAWIHALLHVKRAAAIVNHDLGLLPADKAGAIIAAAEEALGDPQYANAFPLSIWQSGSGTQTHMNVNEVLANRASELLGGGRGASRLIHPNDDVNRGQSSNDVIPTALHIAAALSLEQNLRPALHTLRTSLQDKARSFGGLVKIGRTHLQDATPLTLEQEFSGYVAQLDIAAAALDALRPSLLALAIGGTAVGTGLNTHPEFGNRVAGQLAHDLKLAFISAPNKFAALAGHEPLLAVHGTLKTLAAALNKIAQDIRWLGSGPRAGLGELRLPANEPGSSIMPGKVNPTQCEMLIMAATAVLGNDLTIGIAGAGGNFELNVYKPLIGYAFLQSVRLLTDGMSRFERYCIRDLTADAARIQTLMDSSLMLVTALAPHLGYDTAAQIAQDAHRQNITLRAAAIASGHLTEAQFDAWVQPDNMIGPQT